MIDIKDVWDVITDAGFALQGEGEYDHTKLQSYCRRLQHNVDYRYSSFELNANGRRECAQDESVWEALRCSLNPDFWEDFHSTPKKVDILRDILLFSQFLFAGEPNTHNGDGNANMYSISLTVVIV
jgi:hypothetical protein